jgi:hypothetical protein
MTYSSMASTSRRDFKILVEDLEERRVADGCQRLVCEVVNRLLYLRHAGDVVSKSHISA